MRVGRPSRIRMPGPHLKTKTCIARGMDEVRAHGRACGEIPTFFLCPAESIQHVCRRLGVVLGRAAGFATERQASSRAGQLIAYDWPALIPFVAHDLDRAERLERRGATRLHMQSAFDIVGSSCGYRSSNILDE